LEGRGVVVVSRGELLKPTQAVWYGTCKFIAMSKWYILKMYDRIELQFLAFISSALDDG